MHKIVVLGSNFAGVTAALETARKLKKERIDFGITVISPNPNFLYVPSLIWVPFGLRKVEDITFPIAPVLEKRGIKFILDKATQIHPNQNSVDTEKSGSFSYHFLIVATGVNLNFDDIPGFNQGYTECIVTPPQALKSFEAFKQILIKPGPIVVGATQGASCMGAAYEYLFNLEKQLRKHKVRDKVELTWITPEPFLGHFGIGGIVGGKAMLELFMKMFKINWFCDSMIKEIRPNEMELTNGERLPFEMSMLIPPFIGAEVVRNSEGLSDDKGFLPCKDSYQHHEFENIYAAGLAVQVIAPFTNCAAPFGVPKTGFPSDVQAKTVAKNITHKLKGSSKVELMPFGKIPGICIMDAGSKEVLILTNNLFKPRMFELMIPNVFINVGKLLLEKYMLIKNRLGWSWLP